MATEADARVRELQWVRRRPSRWRSFAHMARRKYLGTASAVAIVVFVVVAVFAPSIAPYDPIALESINRLDAPSAAHLLGTDELGRDQFSRIIYGARVSLIVGLASVAIGVVFGVFLGLTSAYIGGRYDLIVQRFIDSLQAFPSLVLAMVLVATLGASLFNVIVAIAISLVATKARVIRGASLSILQNQYIDAARVIGASNVRIMMTYILPNVWAPIIVLFSASLGSAIIREASLSFLGMGTPPPDPTWGGMLSGSARAYMGSAPWMAIFPGVAITLVVLAFNLLGDTIRDILDPRLRGSQ